MDRLLGMEIFLKVAQLGSLSGAAAQLSMSKSTVSKHIAALENHLGVRLLNRSTRQLSLTEQGELYRERCLAIVQEIEATELTMTQFTSEPRGKLKVNAPMTFGILHVSPLIPGFLERYPEVEIELSLNDRRVDLIEEGYDLAIRIGELDDSSLIGRRLAAACHVCAASPGYLERHGAPATPRDLERHNCLRYAYRRNPNAWEFIHDGEVERVRVSGSFTANNGEALREAAAGGLGICYQPVFIVAGAIKRGELVPILTDYRTPEIVIHAVYPHQRHVAPKLRAFIDFLARVYRGHDWRDGKRAGLAAESAGEAA